MKHWAWSLIGMPYKAGACGPQEFDCIGLVRYCFKTRHNIELPDYLLHKGSSLQLYRFIKATGWRVVNGRSEEDDVLTMDGLTGKHVGVIVNTNEGPKLLHAVGSESRGQVVCQPVPTLIGYKNMRTWRRA
jgi:cell wall-associated NlpC family hydrolase